MNPSIQLKKNLPLVAVVAICFAFSSVAQAVDPPPDGGYPNRNTAEGDLALFSADVEAGNDNTAIGFSTLYRNVGSENTAIGSEALFRNTFSHDNTATGFFALQNNTLGNENTATGSTALLRNTIGSANTATGIAALQSNTTGSNNTATGGAALARNTTGNLNTAIGAIALSNNTTGGSNTALGVKALVSNTTASNNTATGFSALQENTTGRTNTANGFETLLNNTTGSNNTATGVSALLDNVTGNANTANGVRALSNNTTGSRNIALGVDAGLNLITGDHNIFIGNPGFAADSNKIRIGTGNVHTATFIAAIRGVTVPSGLPVVVGPNSQLGTMTSSARFKESIKPMDKTSEVIHVLRPVTFRYKSDTTNTPQFGLIAEEVAAVNPNLVVRDENGEIYTVRYDAVNAMLLNEFLKEHRKVQEQDVTITQVKSTIAKQEATITQQQKQIEALTAGLQKVSAQLEMSKPAPQMVGSDQ
jgi:uncharacterized coiled-coil protein SlyX